MKRRIATILMLAVLASTVMAAGPGVTKANFDKIETGMSYAQVVEILGKDGELLSEGKFGDTVTKIYQWKATKKDKGLLGANMNAMFQNDRVVSKAQYGLR